MSTQAPAFSYADLRGYYPLMYCEVGQHAVRENLMHDETCCIDCAEGGPIKAHVAECAAEQGPLFAEGREA